MLTLHQPSCGKVFYINPQAFMNRSDNQVRLVAVYGQPVDFSLLVNNNNPQAFGEVLYKLCRKSTDCQPLFSHAEPIWCIDFPTEATVLC
jgi:hypothetical protein